MGANEKVMSMVVVAPTAVLCGERRRQEQMGGRRRQDQSRETRRQEPSGGKSRGERRRHGSSRGERRRQEQRGDSPNDAPIAGLSVYCIPSVRKREGCRYDAFDNCIRAHPGLASPTVCFLLSGVFCLLSTVFRLLESKKGLRI